MLSVGMLKIKNDAKIRFTPFYGTPDQDRTGNPPLGGASYIHLTTGAILTFWG